MVRMLVSKKWVSTIHLPQLHVNRKGKRIQILISVAMLSGSDLVLSFVTTILQKKETVTKQNPLINHFPTFPSNLNSWFEADFYWYSF